MSNGLLVITAVSSSLVCIIVVVVVLSSLVYFCCWERFLKLVQRFPIRRNNDHRDPLGLGSLRRHSPTDEGPDTGLGLNKTNSGRRVIPSLSSPRSWTPSPPFEAARPTEPPTSQVQNKCNVFTYEKKACQTCGCQNITRDCAAPDDPNYFLRSKIRPNNSKSNKSSFKSDKNSSARINYINQPLVSQEILPVNFMNDFNTIATDHINVTNPHPNLSTKIVTSIDERPKYINRSHDVNNNTPNICQPPSSTGAIPKMKKNARSHISGYVAPFNSPNIVRRHDSDSSVFINDEVLNNGKHQSYEIRQKICQIHKGKSSEILNHPHVHDNIRRYRSAANLTTRPFIDHQTGDVVYFIQEDPSKLATCDNAKSASHDSDFAVMYINKRHSNQHGTEAYKGPTVTKQTNLSNKKNLQNPLRRESCPDSRQERRRNRIVAKQMRVISNRISTHLQKSVQENIRAGTSNISASRRPRRIFSDSVADYQHIIRPINLEPMLESELESSRNTIISQDERSEISHKCLIKNCCLNTSDEGSYNTEDMTEQHLISDMSENRSEQSQFLPHNTASANWSTSSPIDARILRKCSIDGQRQLSAECMRNEEDDQSMSWDVAADYSPLILSESNNSETPFNEYVYEIKPHLLNQEFYHLDSTLELCDSENEK